MAVNTRLTSAVIEIEQHVATGGWDQAPRLYALVPTEALAREQPEVLDQLGPEATLPGHLTSIEQEELPAYASLEDLLAGIAWPPAVAGTALVVERLMLPPSAEATLPAGDSEALDYIAAHPERQDVRLAVAVLRDGSRECAIRLRSHDRDDAVLSGPDLVPGLTHALAATLLD